RRGPLRRYRAALQAGTGDPGDSARPRSPRCRAIAEQSGRPVQRPGSPRRCRATLQARAGVNARAKEEYPQFLDAFCLGPKEFVLGSVLRRSLRHRVMTMAEAELD